MKKIPSDSDNFNPSAFEDKWGETWVSEQVYEPDMKKASRPYYNLMMFPYPSAEGLHIGNMYAFTGSDIHGRFMRMQGYDVFEPIGLDGFGIHSENYALKLGQHPKALSKKTEENFYRQLSSIGNGYAWKHKVETYDPNYYKWTQWLFIQLFKHGLAYRKEFPVNWCPSCKTVLADEQVLQNQKSNLKNQKLREENIKSNLVGLCERCGSEVEVKNLTQWFFRITAYAERLLENIKKLDWPEKVLVGQKNWIGQSIGAEVIFKLEGHDISIPTFTTRIDTIYGVTAIVIAPNKKDNDGISNLALNIATKERRGEVETYILQNQKSKIKSQKSAEEAEKTGVFTGAYAINPFSGERVQIWVSDYVVSWYGTGALMVVPAHDVRDMAFAKKYKIPIKPVIKTKKLKALVLKDSVGDDFAAKLQVGKIPITVAENGDLQVELTWRNIDQFISLVQNNLRPDYCVEIVGDRTIFIFGDGELIEVKTPEDEQRILTKCRKLEKSISQVASIWEMLTDVLFYLDTIAITEHGVLINSGEYTGLTTAEAQKKMTDYLLDSGSGRPSKQYKLRDWIISRQRYWGAPIPLVYCETCAKAGRSWFSLNEARDEFKMQNAKFKMIMENSKLMLDDLVKDQGYFGWYPVDEVDLPVLLPDVSDWRPKGTGKSPLASVPEFVNVDCPACGSPAVRETDVCDTFLDSSWYYLRYPSVSQNQKSKIKSQNDNAKLKMEKELPWNTEVTAKWLPVNQYTGGAEHTVLHLLYSRFVTMALSDMGYFDFDEPFPRFYAHGLIIKDGAKMSKSRGNVVVPDEYIRKHGADALRCYLMFLGPYESGGDFRDSGIHGMFKFLKRVWNLYHNSNKVNKNTSGELGVLLHKTIHKVSRDLGMFKYNTTLAFYMEFVNKWNSEAQTLSQEDAISFLKLLAPFAPFMTEEIYQEKIKSQKSKIKNDKEEYLNREKFSSIHSQLWPQYDERLVKEDVVSIIVQVNGKIRANIEITTDEANEEDLVVNTALKDERVRKYITERSQAKRVVFVSGRVVNFVV